MFLPLRPIALTLIGVASFISGAVRLNKPAQAVERSGWLYQQFGDHGVPYGMMAMGVVFSVVGAWWVWRAFTR